MLITALWLRWRHFRNRGKLNKQRVDYWLPLFLTKHLYHARRSDSGSTEVFMFLYVASNSTTHKSRLVPVYYFVAFQKSTSASAL